jgi:hypothetical protein
MALMHVTTVKTKDGKTFKGVLWTFKPEQGYMTLFGIYEHKIRFDNIVSATTEGERITVNKIGTQDELGRAKKLMKEAREFNWFGMNKDTPLQDWEK